MNILNAIAGSNQVSDGVTYIGKLHSSQLRFFVGEYSAPIEIGDYQLRNWNVLKMEGDSFQWWIAGTPEQALAFIMGMLAK